MCCIGFRDLRGAAVEAPADPLTDEQARQQVVEPARQFVEAGRLDKASATYMLLSCTNRQDPPYQGAVYLDFSLPAPGRRDGTDRIDAAMTARGWSVALPPAHPGGRTPTKDGVTAVYYPNLDVPAGASCRSTGSAATSPTTAPTPPAGSTSPPRCAADTR